MLTGRLLCCVVIAALALQVAAAAQSREPLVMGATLDRRVSYQAEPVWLRYVLAADRDVWQLQHPVVTIERKERRSWVAASHFCGVACGSVGSVESGREFVGRIRLAHTIAALPPGDYRVRVLIGGGVGGGAWRSDWLDLTILEHAGNAALYATEAAKKRHTPWFVFLARDPAAHWLAFETRELPHHRFPSAEKQAEHLRQWLALDLSPDLKAQLRVARASCLVSRARLPAVAADRKAKLLAAAMVELEAVARRCPLGRMALGTGFDAARVRLEALALSNPARARSLRAAFRARWPRYGAVRVTALH